MLGAYLGIITVGVIYLVFEIVMASLRGWIVKNKKFLRAFLGIEFKPGGKNAKRKD